MINWTPDLEDQFLNLVLPCDSQLEYDRALVTFGKLHGRESTISIREGDQYLRRRAKRRTEYLGRGLVNRPHRMDLPFSWVENRILTWSENWQSESKISPDPEYLAHLLLRTIDEIVLEKSRRKTTRMGIPGFDLDEKDEDASST